MACSMHSNCTESCSIIWRSGSAREMPKLVFCGVLLARGGAERLHGGGAISVWVSQHSRDMLLASAATTAGIWVVTITLATCYAMMK
jgi:hypothetical protein